jgi:hypothetical protein
LSGERTRRSPANLSGSPKAVCQSWKAVSKLWHVTRIHCLVFKDRPMVQGRKRPVVRASDAPIRG